ncbi:MAG: hypothetical protein H5T42_02290 [Methanothrix sp.]|jgi:hypothetical protein|uniref:Uncharacterized protein n=1 Tax=Methanothrix thermoacetophila (strain DSM 6194 / JCM 14653 / NBRC 101360 / PT) TaxID=349307 RepID=A0B8V0_METTP|nr:MULTISPECIES: hypothetical protein [Methanothrix]ABK15124.1 hypothetical protein Mthe_1349 [Methanothrix thermoacetophila PT]MBC7079292.1 hypothetical protein [Methanothrix sp.]NPU86756.1 hypothetical protein [Methanothrix sp.]
MCRDALLLVCMLFLMISGSLAWAHISYGTAEAQDASLHPAIHGFRTEDMVGVFSIEKRIVLASGDPSGGVAEGIDSQFDARLGPYLLNLTIEPRVMNASLDTLNISLTLSEIGASPPLIKLVSPSGGMSAEVQLNQTSTADSTGGVVYRGDIRIPADAEPGRWRISWLRACDSQGHSILLGEDELNARGFPTFIDVRSRGMSPLQG